MCTIAFSYKQHPEFPLILAANRDEFYARPTRGMHWWEDQKFIFGGRDLKEGGSWMGMNKNGRFATLTNYRVFPLKENTPSRGDLVRNFIDGDHSPAQYFEILQQTGADYNGFNLIFGNSNQLYYISNMHSAINQGKKIPEGTLLKQEPELGELRPGVYALSNALLQSPWPKAELLKESLTEYFNQPEKFFNKTDLFEILQRKSTFPDNQLPNTGIGIDRERPLSALFIEMPGYGTRSSWYLSVNKDSFAQMGERNYKTDTNNTKLDYQDDQAQFEEHFYSWQITPSVKESMS